MGARDASEHFLFPTSQMEDIINYVGIVVIVVPRVESNDVRTT